MENERKPINLGRGSLVWTIWNFAEAALLIVLGVLSIAFSSNTDFQKFVILIIGIFCMIGGLLRLLSNFLPIFAATRAEAEFKAKMRAELSYSMTVIGSLELALGIAITIFYAKGQLTEVMTFFARFLTTYIGIVLIVAGASFVVFAIAFLISRLYKAFLPVSGIILGLALAALGIVIMVVIGDDADTIMKVILIMVGVVTILAGFGEIAGTVMAVSEKRKHEDRVDKRANPNQFDEELTPIEEEPKHDVVETNLEENDNPRLENKD